MTFTLIDSTVMQLNVQTAMDQASYNMRTNVRLARAKGLLSKMKNRTIMRNIGEFLIGAFFYYADRRLASLAKITIRLKNIDEFEKLLSETKTITEQLKEKIKQLNEWKPRVEVRSSET